MIRHRGGSILLSQLAILMLVTAAPVCGQLPGRMGTPGLAGSSWQLVSFRGTDGRVTVPAVRSNYTIAFGTDGRVSAQIDCNRGSGTWTTSGTNQLTFGPLATTRAYCPRGSLYDSIVRNWPYLRTYAFRNGHLFLSVNGNGGTYEFEPIAGGQASGSAVRGTATYSDRFVLPHTAVFEATLEDVNGAQPELIARIRNEQPGNVPIPFVISYDASRIIQSHSYLVRARILVNGSEWFTTNVNYPVLTAGHGSDVQLLLRRVGSSGTPLPGRSDGIPITLENTYWKLISMPNTVVRAGTPQQGANITLHSSNKTMSGSGGCNRISGGYSLSGDRLSFGRTTSTMMACADPIMTNTEQIFLKALPRVTRWRIMAASLELLDSAGKVVATFEPVHM